MRRVSLTLGAACLAILATQCTGAPTGADERELAQSQAVTSVTRTLPRNARPVRRFGTPLPENPAGCQAFTYYGGRVVSNVQVVLVNWTAVDSTVTSFLPGFYTAITNSSYMDLMAQYATNINGVDGMPGSNQTIGRGTYLETVTITPAMSGMNVQDAQIQTELAAQITAGTLPQPALDAAGNVNTVYMFDFPQGYTIFMDPNSPSCTNNGFCAYHSTATINGKSVPYGIVPYMGPGGPCATGCGGSGNPSYTDTLAVNHSHELAESITDTEVGIGGAAVGRPMAWYADGNGNCGEIADLCDPQPNAMVAGYTVESIWSNTANGCAVGPTDMDAGGVDSGVDSGGPMDSGVADTGVVDTGVPDTGVDASASTDSGSAPDASMGNDAAATHDSGRDTGAAAMNDSGSAGAGSDSGPGGNGAGPGTTSGCSCRVGSTRESQRPAGGGSLLVLGLLAVRRRRAHPQRNE